MALVIFKKIEIHPLYKILISFIVLIVSGSFLLKIPAASTVHLSYIDALFTSTSAVCVTGLIVVDTAKDFTLMGLIILILIQFGGFGIMTFSLGLFSLFGKDLSLKWRYTFEGLYNETGVVPIRSILIRVIKYTFIIELFTAIILFIRFINDFTFFQALGHSIFHAVSAFCNAGFSTFSDSLMQYNKDYIVLISISLAIISGGLGFIVLNEIMRIPRFIKQKKNILSMHSKIIIIITFFLIITGMAAFFILENDNILKNQTISQSLLNSFFQSITCRTAGFNSIDMSLLKGSTLLMMIVLMFIGGSPGSIAGGIKKTTLAVIGLFIISKFKGKKDVSIFNRSLDHETVDRSITLFIFAISFIFIITFILMSLHGESKQTSFLPILFETVSAFGTVGLSMGMTGKIVVSEKIILIVVMLIGRLGLLTLLMIFTLKNKEIQYEYPREHIMIG
jgi:trk system potassium uptake protein TrkH